MLTDLRTSFRTLLRRPGFTVATIATLAVGIGVATAIFSVVDAILLRPLPYPEPDEVVQVRHVGEDGGSQISLSYPNFVDLRRETRSFEAMGAYTGTAATATGEGQATRVNAAQVTDGFFDALGVAPVVGRLPSSEELGGSGSSVAVVGYGYWQGRLGGDPALSDAVIRVGGRAYDVVGVMPEGITFPGETEVWFPSTASLANQTRTGHNFQVIGRLGEGVTLDEARGDASTVARRLAELHGEATWMADASLVPLRDELVGGVRQALYLLLGAAGLLLLIAGVNVASLLLTRMVARQDEVSIRRALGATSGRLAVQSSSETLLLSALGGVIGILLAVWGVRALMAVAPAGIPRADEVGVSWTVFAFAAVVSLVIALALGMIPAVYASIGSSVGGMGRAGTEGGRGQSPGRSSRRALRTLAASQIALTVVLLVGAGLLGRSLLTVISVDPGYRTEGAVVMDVWAGATHGQERGQLLRELLDGLPTRAGVEEVGTVSAFPLAGFGGNGTFVILDDPDQVAGLSTFEEARSDPEAMERIANLFQGPESNTGYAEFRHASAGYFRAMDIPLVRGRLFDGSDGPDAPHAAVISQSLADEQWPDRDPIGEYVEYGNMDGDLRPFVIVGIVGDVRERSLEAPPQPTFYGNARQRATSANFSVVLAGTGDPARTIAGARELVAEIDPDVAVRFRTLGEIFSASIAERRFGLLLVGVFGGAALLLATIGVFGVVSYLVSHRRREIGVRIAMGATRRAIRRMVVRQGAVLAGVGIAIGLILVAGLSDLGRSFLYEVAPVDPVTYVGTAGVLLAVGLAAAWIPAARAAAVEPTEALRAE